MTNVPFLWLSKKAKDVYASAEYFLFGRCHHCLCGAWILDSAPVIGDLRAIHYTTCTWAQDEAAKRETEMAAFKAQRVRR